MGTLRRPWNDPSGAKETWWTSQICQRKWVVVHISVSKRTLCCPQNDLSGAKDMRWNGQLRRSGNRTKQLVLSLSAVTLARVENPYAKWRYLT